MVKDYSKYSVEDFLKDTSFLIWCFDPDKESSQFWRSFMTDYPEAYPEFCKAVQIMNSVDLESEYMPSADKENLLARIQADYRKAGKRRRIGLWCAAACVAILAGIFLLVPKTYKTDNATDSDLLAGVENIRVVYGASDSGFRETNAKTAVIVCNGAGTISVNGCTLDAISGKCKLIVPYGKRAELHLSDSTCVWVNSGSVVSFPPVFNGKARKVEMTGEAYFNVSRDAERPFIVTTELFRTKVLGTSFNINTYGISEQSSFLVLEEGKVEVSIGGDDVLFLTENDMISVKGESYSIMEVDPKLYTAWKDGLLIFASEKLSSVLGKVGKYYNVEVTCSADIENLRCTGRLVLFDDLFDTLEILSTIFLIQFDVSHNDEGKFCIEAVRQ